MKESFCQIESHVADDELMCVKLQSEVEKLNTKVKAHQDTIKGAQATIKAGAQLLSEYRTAIQQKQAETEATLSTKKSDWTNPRHRTTAVLTARCSKATSDFEELREILQYQAKLQAKHLNELRHKGKEGERLGTPEAHHSWQHEHDLIEKNTAQLMAIKKQNPELLAELQQAAMERMAFKKELEVDPLFDKNTPSLACLFEHPEEEDSWLRSIQETKKELEALQISLMANCKKDIADIMSATDSIKKCELDVAGAASNAETAGIALSEQKELLGDPADEIHQTMMLPPGEADGPDLSPSPYHYVDEQGQPQGPLELDQLKDLFASKVVTPDTHVICHGETEWQVLEDKADLLQKLRPEAAATQPQPASQPASQPTPASPVSPSIWEGDSEPACHHPAQPAKPPPPGPYHYVDVQGQPQGPMELDQLKGLFASKVVTPETNIICHGGTDWKLLQDEPDLLAALQDDNAKPPPSIFETQPMKPTQPPPPGPYHYVDEQGQPQGPLELDQLKGLFASKVVTPETHIICHGETEWQVLETKSLLLDHLK